MLKMLCESCGKKKLKRIYEVVLEDGTSVFWCRSCAEHLIKK